MDLPGAVSVLTIGCKYLYISRLFDFVIQRKGVGQRWTVPVLLLLVTGLEAAVATLAGGLRGAKPPAGSRLPRDFRRPGCGRCE